MIEQTYPSGRKVKNTLDTNGDLAQVQSGRNADSSLRNYANAFTYNAAGAVSAMRLGNGLWERTEFNSRLQPVMIGLGTGSAVQNRLRLDYAYGELQSNGTIDTTKNNGNLARQTISFAGLTHPFVQTYSYDSLNRLKSAVETQNSVQVWKQTFTFDRYGNRRFDTVNTTTIPAGCAEAVCNPQIDPSTNKLVGYVFDTAGNTTTDANGQTFTYDAENKQVKVQNGSQVIGEYFYDGDGKRVKKTVPATGETTIFVYDASGKLVAEYSTQVESVQNAKVAYLTADHLGSPRILTDENGATISRRDFHPFGEEVFTAERTAGIGYQEDDVRQKFTGYERDNEINLDYAGARYYNNAHGRFTSTDPILIKKDRLVDPQRLNLYVYVRNSPYKFVDTTGEDLILANSNARATFRQVTTNGLTRAERNNIRVLTNGRVVLRNPNAINVQNASYAYQQIADIVSNRNLTINVYSVAQRQTAQGVSYQDAYDSAGVTLGSPGDATRDVVIPVGGGVQVLGNPPGSGNLVPTTEDTIFAHEVFGHANGNDGDDSITAENNYRRSRNPAIGERSGEDHRYEVQVSAPAGLPITTTPAQIQTTIIPRPLPTPPPPPKKPEELED